METYKKQPRPRVTYILGSRCKDGVVLVSDTKITVDGGARYEYEDKLTGEILRRDNWIFG